MRKEFEKSYETRAAIPSYIAASKFCRRQERSSSINFEAAAGPSACTNHKSHLLLGSFRDNVKDGKTGIEFFGAPLPCSTVLSRFTFIPSVAFGAKISVSYFFNIVDIYIYRKYTPVYQLTTSFLRLTSAITKYSYETTHPPHFANLINAEVGITNSNVQ